MSANSSVIVFAYEDHKVFTEFGSNKEKHSGKCRFCRSRITEPIGVTSGFTRHLKKQHKAKYEEYVRNKGKEDDKQPGILKFVSSGPSSSHSSGPVQLYSVNHPRQKAINDAIVKDLIVGCSLPISLVNNPHFCHFMKTVDPRWCPMARSTVTRARLPELYSAGKERIKSILQDHQYISLTADIWSDRVMRSFLGVTAHVIIPSADGNLKLQSFLLSCERFHGSHSGARISSAFDTLVDEYSIKNKITFIITDNASNMKAAFKANFPTPRDISDEGDILHGEEQDNEELDDESLWEQIDQDESAIVDMTLENNSKQRLACFAHTLQLVVGKGLKETRSMSVAIGKARKMAATLHRSTIFKERFESKIGTNRSLPTANATRWNSTFHLLKTMRGYNFKTLVEDVCGTEFSSVAFTVHEWGQLSELVQVLEPFADATDATQGESNVTISLVVPTVLDLSSHLKKMKGRARYTKNIITALQDGLFHYFPGIYTATGVTPVQSPDTHDEPFGDKIYLAASVLDPEYGLTWVDVDVPLDGKPTSFADDLKDRLKELVIDEAEEISDVHVLQQHTSEAHSTSSEEGEDSEPPAKASRLQAKYQQFRKRNRSGETSKATPRAQLHQYLEEIQQLPAGTVSGGPLQFWSEHKSQYPALYCLALKILGVPASSAPVERVFSRGGIIMRPHRARLSANMLQIMMFLKCNEQILNM